MLQGNGWQAGLQAGLIICVKGYPRGSHGDIGEQRGYREQRGHRGAKETQGSKGDTGEQRGHTGAKGT